MHPSHKASVAVSTDPSEEIWKAIRRAAKTDDDTAARERLAAGFPIYYSEDDTPDGLVIKRHPCGRRELVRCDPAGDQVIRVL
ncbi:MAG: hypothetical protein CMM61_03370 [Rhodospirillaceae bacterium]|nr:hypothetical protein [Rhodospirillaceae bacterium]